MCSKLKNNMINKENFKYFNQPNEADKWIWRIKNGVVNWVEKNKKSFWYIVLWESKRMGVLCKDISRLDFAALIYQECKDSLPETYTKDTIFHNIEKFKYKRHLQEFDKQPDSSFVRKYVKEVSELLTADIPISSTNEDFVLELCVEDYLKRYTVNESYTRIIRNPIYEGKTTTLAFENYVSKKFWDENRPSHRILFECVNERLTAEMVEILHGRFCSMTNTKLFVVSTHAFSGQVKKEADRHHSIDDSLSFALYQFGSCNKENLFVAAPVLSDEEIEAEAFRFVQPQADRYASVLSCCDLNDKVPVCEIDPYPIAIEMGLTMKRGKTGRSLGHIDIGHKSVTLSDQVDINSPNGRFFMAHEIGHNHFHRRVSEKAEDGIHSIVQNTKKWLEHHANYFASCLLMPANVVRQLYYIYWKKEFLLPLHRRNTEAVNVNGG